MNQSAAHLDQSFIHPADALAAPAPDIDVRRPSSFDFAHARREHHQQAAHTRRSSRMRRVLPLAIAAVAAVTFSLLTEGGRQAREATPLVAYLGHGLERLGLGLSEVIVRGQRETLDSAIYDKLKLDDSRSIWLFDTAAARHRVEALPWVRRASLKRVFPDQLHIGIHERVPYAVWNNGSRSVLIDETGRVLGAVGARRTIDLPVIFGEGAAPHARSIVETVSRMPELRGKVAIYEWSANRRWSFHLKSGQRILLPETGLSSAIVSLIKGKRGERLLDANFETLDLRLSNQVAVEFRK